MQLGRAYVLATILLIAGSVLVSSEASAHSGGMFTLILKGIRDTETNETTNVIDPANATMIVNDTARWINTDDADNVTHRILVDSNSDGIYDGEGDWDSGNLTDSCEYINGTKIDQNCKRNNLARKEKKKEKNCKNNFLSLKRYNGNFFPVLFGFSH